MEKLARDLLYLVRYNHDRGNWKCGLEDKETWKVIAAIAQHNEFSEIIDKGYRRLAVDIFSG